MDELKNMAVLALGVNITLRSCNPSFDIEVANQAFSQWKKNKKSIMPVRGNPYGSPMSGTMASAYHTEWKDALDDSLERFFRHNKSDLFAGAIAPSGRTDFKQPAFHDFLFFESGFTVVL